MMPRLQLALVLLTTLSLGIVGGSCMEPEWEIQMIKSCPPRPSFDTCREMCKESGSFQCMESDDCLAPAFGLDLAECELGDYYVDGTPLDVGCDDPLPAADYVGFTCCCSSRATKY